MRVSCFTQESCYLRILSKSYMATQNYFFRREWEYMNQKLEEMIATARLNDMLNKKEQERKTTTTIVIILAVIGAIAAIAGIAYAVVKYFTPDYLDDDFDDFDDDFDDDFYSDDEVVTIPPTASEE